MGMNFIWQKRILGKLKYPFLMTINEIVEYTQHNSNSLLISFQLQFFLITLSRIITTYKQHTMTFTLYYLARQISLQLVYYMLDIFIFHKFTVRYYSWCPFVVETGILD